MGREFYTVAEVAKRMGRNPQKLREQARKDPQKLGFPVCIAGNRISIPAEAFENWRKGTC